MANIPDTHSPGAMVEVVNNVNTIARVPDVVALDKVIHADLVYNALLDAAFVGPLPARQAADMFGDAPFGSAKRSPKLAALDSILRELEEEDYAEF